jgi:hypothetical protein
MTEYFIQRCSHNTRPENAYQTPLYDKKRRMKVRRQGNVSYIVTNRFTCDANVSFLVGIIAVTRLHANLRVRF